MDREGVKKDCLEVEDCPSPTSQDARTEEAEQSSPQPEDCVDTTGMREPSLPPARDGKQQGHEPLLLKSDPRVDRSVAGPSGVRISDSKRSAERRAGARDNNLRNAGVAAWLPNGPAAAAAPAAHRWRLGPLPSRRTYGASGALKQPRGLASCVIREDMPYPPANAEVTFEIRINTVRHGRKLLRYSASSPLDTIYIKIPNTAPSSLQQPVLGVLSHTIDLGHQRIVVGGGVRPGCALLAIDLMSLDTGMDVGMDVDVGVEVAGGRPPPPPEEGDEEADLPAGLPGGVEEEREGDGAVAVGSSGGGRLGAPGAPPPPWLHALGTAVELLSSEEEEEEDGSSGRGRGSGGQLAAAVAAVGAGLSRSLHGLGVEVSEGLRLQLHFRGTALQAEFRGSPRGWELTLLPQQPEAQPTAAAAAAAAADGGGGRRPLASCDGVVLSPAQQVLVAPTAVGEAVKISVRARGLPDQAADQGGGDGGVGTGSGSGSGGGGVCGRCYFAVRGLGRYLPVRGGLAPTKPARLDLDSDSESGGEGPVSSVEDDDCAGRGSVLAVAVVAAAAAAAATSVADGEVATAAAGVGAEAEEGFKDADGGDYGGSDGMGIAAHTGGGGGGGGAAGAPDIPAPEPHRARRQPRSRLVPPQSSGGGFSGGGSSREASTATAALSAAAAADPACHYELTVAGLGAGGAGGDAGPVLLQLELWHEDMSRLLAAKPLLLLPPALAGLVAELQALLRMQQKIQEEEEEEVAAAARGERGQQGGGAGGLPSSADQLLMDMGMWLEFIHDSLQAPQAETEVDTETEAEMEAAAATTATAAAAASGSGGCLGERGAVLLPGSLDLRPEVRGYRRGQPAFTAGMLRTGLGLLEAVVAYGSGTLAAHLLADFRSLGYDAAEMWTAAGTVTAAEGAAAGGSLLHLAAASGDLATLAAVADLAEASAVGGGGGDHGDGVDGSDGCWWLRDGDGRTPLHLLVAAAADGDAGLGSATAAAAAAALEWVLTRGGGAARNAWREARDSYGMTPAGLLAALEAAEAETARRLGAAPGPGVRLIDSLEKLLPAPPASPGAPEEPAAAAAPAAHAVSPSPSLASCLDACSGLQGGASSCPLPPAGPGASLEPPAGWGWSRCRRRAAAMAALIRASLVGFDAAGGVTQDGSDGGTDGTDGTTELRYQAYVSRRTLMLAHWWVVLHLLLTASAVRRVLAEGKAHEVAAPLLYSSGHMVMLLVLRAAPGFRLYLPHCGAWWSLASLLRTSSKVAQLVGLVALPGATLRYVRGGATLVADGVLPALFEPCPLPYALVFLLYDYIVTAVLYLRIGYAADPVSSLLRAAIKCGVALSLRLAVDVTHRAAFLKHGKHYSHHHHQDNHQQQQQHHHHHHQQQAGGQCRAKQPTTEAPPAAAAAAAAVDAPPAAAAAAAVQGRCRPVAGRGKGKGKLD